MILYFTPYPVTDIPKLNQVMAELSVALGTEHANKLQNIETWQSKRCSISMIKWTCKHVWALVRIGPWRHVRRKTGAERIFFAFCIEYIEG